MASLDTDGHQSMTLIRMNTSVMTSFSEILHWPKLCSECLTGDKCCVIIEQIIVATVTESSGIQAHPFVPPG